MIRKTVTTLLTTLTIITYGQITTTKVAPKSDQFYNTPYDSTQNFLGKDVYKYIGQELYLNGKAEGLREYGYDGFLTDYNKSKFEGGVYKCCDSYNSKYDELAGKYFKVLEIIKHTKAEQNEYPYGKKFYLKLQEKESNDIVYYEYDSEFEYSFPFIVIGFFEKLKMRTIGQKFVFGNTKFRFGDDELDVKSGKVIVFELGEGWECIDVTIEERYFNLSLILKDNNGQTLAINYNIAIGSNKFHNVFTKKEADKYKTKFGITAWQTILQGKVKIGMTKEMCKLSWGEPKSINKIITSGKRSEQWVYSDNFLYFDNGILTAIQ
jgi:hypothetical protein